jgi:hypothetical protein
MKKWPPVFDAFSAAPYILCTPACFFLENKAKTLLLQGFLPTLQLRCFIAIFFLWAIGTADGVPFRPWLTDKLDAEWL